MTDTLAIAVVGHTNAGKTSLLRTLTRRERFGEVSNLPGTTRHVEAIDLIVEGESAVRFFDTPGLEDAVTLADYLKSLENCPTPPDRIRAFLQGPEARSAFEQEAKVLRTMLEVDAGFYVIDTREAVLPKFQAELEILTWCAKPVMPVLNHIRAAHSRKAEWLTALAAYNLHANVQFDAVAPFVGSELTLYHDLGTLLRDRREFLNHIVADLSRQQRERRDAGCRVIARLLIAAAALRRALPQEEFDVPHTRTQFIDAFRNTVLTLTRRAIEDLLAIYGFRMDDADDTVLPWLDGRWESDLFNPELLREAGRKLGAGAVVGGAIGLAADIALAGLSLGAGTAMGAAIGGLASQGWGQLARRLSNKVRGMQELSLENEVLLVMAEQMLSFLSALEQRGHAAQGKIKPASHGDDQAQHLKQLIATLQDARAYPQWEKHSSDSSHDARHARLVEDLHRALSPLLESRLQTAL